MIEPVADLILDRIEQHDANRPRSLQADVGPSDLGGECDHCLAAKFAGWQKKRELAWLPYIGTAVHEYLGKAFDASTGEWLVEQPVSVGTIMGRDVWGTADLYHLPTRTVIDFKIVGVKTLRDARAGRVSEQYRRQVHLYGKGFEARNVAVLFLPRSSPNLHKDLVWHAEALDVKLATDTLRHASILCAGVNAAENEEDYIATLARAEGCYDCPRYHDWDTHFGATWAAVPARPIDSMTEAMGL